MTWPDDEPQERPFAEGLAMKTLQRCVIETAMAPAGQPVGGPELADQLLARRSPARSSCLAPTGCYRKCFWPGLHRLILPCGGERAPSSIDGGSSVQLSGHSAPG